MLRFAVIIFVLFTFDIAYSEKDYTIVKGDTLWDISGEFYGNSYQWPIIWKYNTYINDPDLIFPDNELVIPILFEGESFHLKDKEATVKLGKDTKRKDKVSQLPENPSGEGIPFYEIDFNKIRSIELILASKPQFNVISTEGEKSYVSKGNLLRINADAGDVNKGDKLTFYRKESEIKEGVVYKIVGTGEVYKTEKNNAIVKISSSYAAIQEGFYADKYVNYSFAEPKTYETVNSDIVGKILFMTNNMRVSGEGYRCIISLGHNNNIKKGDVLNIYQQVEENDYYRNIMIGKAQIIYSGDTTSTAQIIDSKREVTKGNSVVLRKVAIN